MDQIKRIMLTKTSVSLKSLRKKRPNLIIGFPGTGLVGSIALSQYCDEMRSEFIGYIDSPLLAPLASIHNYKPLPAVRIHYIKEHNTVVFFSEMTIPIRLSEAFANEILKLADELNSGYIISIGGIVMSQAKPIYYVASNEKLTNSLKNMGTPIKEGATTGITALLLTNGSVNNKNIISILAHVENDYIDPKAAANGLKALSRIIGKKIDVTELIKEANILKMRAKDKVVKSKLLERNVSDTNMYG